MPIIGLKNELLNRDLQIIPVQGFPISTTWQLVWMKNKNLSPVADSLLNYLKQEKDRIIEDKFKWTKDY